MTSDVEELSDPVDVAEPAAAVPVSAEAIHAVFTTVDGLRQEVEDHIVALRKRWSEEPMRQTFTKQGLYDAYRTFAEGMAMKLGVAVRDLEAHQPEPEPTVGCKQCPKMIPLSLVRAHKQWHLQLSLEESEE